MPTNIKIIPTEGAYQENKTGSFVRETKTLIVINVDGEFSDEWKFNKADMLRVGSNKKEFPRWKLVMTEGLS